MGRSVGQPRRPTIRPATFFRDWALWSSFRPGLLWLCRQRSRCDVRHRPEDTSTPHPPGVRSREGADRHRNYSPQQCRSGEQSGDRPGSAAHRLWFRHAGVAGCGVVAPCFVQGGRRGPAVRRNRQGWSLSFALLCVVNAAGRRRCRDARCSSSMPPASELAVLLVREVYSPAAFQASTHPLPARLENARGNRTGSIRGSVRCCSLLYLFRRQGLAASARITQFLVPCCVRCAVRGPGSREEAVQLLVGAFQLAEEDRACLAEGGISPDVVMRRRLGAGTSRLPRSSLPRSGSEEQGHRLGDVSAGGREPICRTKACRHGPGSTWPWRSSGWPSTGRSSITFQSEIDDQWQPKRSWPQRVSHSRGQVSKAAG